MQVLAWIPVSQFVASLYVAHPGFCNVLLDTAFSLAAALFAFVILPAGDFIIGQEPPEAVRNIIQTLSNVGSAGQPLQFASFQSAQGKAFAPQSPIKCIMVC